MLNTRTIIYPLINIIKCLHIHFCLHPFYRLEQKSKNNFVRLGVNETKKICFWNLPTFNTMTFYLPFSNFSRETFHESAFLANGLDHKSATTYNAIILHDLTCLKFNIQKDWQSYCYKISKQILAYVKFKALNVTDIIFGRS